MPWNECLYQYHKKYGGQFLAGESDDALLLLSFKDRPLAVGVRMSGGGRYGPYPYVQARVPVQLAKPYELTIGAEKMLSGGVNAVLKAVPNVAGYSADYGYPEITKKRLIRTDNQPFTKLVLGSLDLRNALLACPGDRVEVRPGPGEEGLHQITVTTDANLNSVSSDWYTANDYASLYISEEDRAQIFRRIEGEFFSRLDRFLDLARAAYNAVTQWPM